MPPSTAINGEPDVALDPDDADRPQLPTDDEDGPSEADDDEFALPPDGQGLEEDTEDDEEDESDGEDGAESGPESDVYEAEEIRAERVKGGKTQYEIKWLDYDSDQNTWETADRVADDLLADWKKTKPAAAAGGAAGAAAGAAPAGAAADAAADADDEDDADDEESRTSPS